MAYGVVRTDNMYGTDVAAGLVSVRYMGEDGATPTEIENGSVLKLGGLIAGEREVFVGGAVAAEDKLSDIVLIASPEVMYDERKKNFDEYINEAGKNCRGYHFHSGDIFSVTKEALIGTAPAVDKLVVLAEGTKMSVADSAAGATVVGKIIAEDIVGRHTYYAVKVD